MPRVRRGGRGDLVRRRRRRSQSLNERTEQRACSFVGKLKVGRGDQGAEQPPWRWRPLRDAFVNVAAPSRGVITAGREAEAECEHGERELLGLLCGLAALGLGFAVTKCCDARLGEVLRIGGEQRCEIFGELRGAG